MKLLLIESESDIVLRLYGALHRVYSIECASSGRSGLHKLTKNNYDIIILDLDLPDIPGQQVCEYIRSTGCTTPVLVLANAQDVASKVTLLDSGANDYLTKPFQREELEARLRVIARKERTHQTHHSRLVVDDLVLDTHRHFATRGGIPIMLRRKEFAILECLMRNAGNVVTVAILAAQAWENEHDSLTNTLHVHMKHLRDKIDRPFKTSLIRTVHGFGYKIEQTALRKAPVRK